MIIPENSTNRETLNQIMSLSASRSSRAFMEYFSAHTKEELTDKADYSLEIMGIFENDSPALIVNFKDLSTNETINQTLVGEINLNKAAYLSDITFKLWADLNEDSINALSSPPLFLEELSSKDIIANGAPDFKGYASATDVSVKKNGNILLAMSSFCFELDENFNILGQIGKDILDQGNYTFAFGVSVTPGDTVYLKPASGREIFKNIKGIPLSTSIGAGIEVTGPIAVLNNGVVILLDLAARRFVRIEGKKRESIDFDLGPYTFVMAMTNGPGGNLWLYDSTEQRIKIYTDKGILVDSLMPVGLDGEILSPTSIACYNDGSFLLFSSGKLYKFDKRGILMWKIDGYNSSNYESLPGSSVKIGIDSKNAFIYLTDLMGNRLIKLYDPAVTFEETPKSINTILEFNESWIQDPQSKNTIWPRIDYYLENRSWIMAKKWLDRILEIDSKDERANSLSNDIEFQTLITQIDQLKEETFDTIDKLGPESARETFRRTIKLYEKAISLKPQNRNLETELSRFKQGFNRSIYQIDNDSKSILVSDIKINNIFPSLIHYYLKNSIGSITLKNELRVPINNVKAQLDLRQFIDYPKESPTIPLLAPGEEITIDLFILLNKKAFNIEEDLPILSKIEITYELNGTVQKLAQTKEITLYRRTALSWGDTRKMAPFITPNEGVVSTFSHRVLSENQFNQGLSIKMSRAARICDALGTYGINYVEDPASPFSKILGDDEHVDTVRYARTTLHIKSGDCDDTTALLMSLLESSGIKTAIMTSPGHVFLAFDTEEPIANKWIFEKDNYQFIEHKGTMWIPLESTVLSTGFENVWKYASQIINREDSKNIDFIPLAPLRESFPPLPLEESTLQIIEPTHKQTELLFNKTINSLTKNFYEDNIKVLQMQISNSSTVGEIKIKNKMAILHGRFNNFFKAETILRELIEVQNSYISPYMNLGNLYYTQKEYSKALEVFLMAYEIKPHSTMLNLALAKTHYKLEDHINTEKFYRIVENQSISLSVKFSYLMNESNTSRAGIDQEPPLEWSTEE